MTPPTICLRFHQLMRRIQCHLCHFSYVFEQISSWFHTCILCQCHQDYLYYYDNDDAEKDDDDDRHEHHWWPAGQNCLSLFHSRWCKIGVHVICPLSSSSLSSSLSSSFLPSLSSTSSSLSPGEYQINSGCRLASWMQPDHSEEIKADPQKQHHHQHTSALYIF